MTDDERMLRIAAAIRDAEPRMWRPDLGLLAAERYLADIEAMEREGMLVRDEGGGDAAAEGETDDAPAATSTLATLVGAASMTEAGRLMMEHGIVWGPLVRRIAAFIGPRSDRS